MADLHVTFLGTSSATPTRSRSLPAVALTREGEVILMDCGEGVQTQIVKYGIGFNRVALVLISHLHGDHVNGLPGLLQTMSMSQRTSPLSIVAPAALERWLRTSVKVQRIMLGFELRFVPVRSGVVHRGVGYVVRATRARHSVESFAYLLAEDPRPGVFDPSRALRLGIPEGKKWSSLQRGRSVLVKGRKFRPSDVMGKRRPGRRVGYSGDTRPSARLVRFFAGCDLLVFDSTFRSDDADRALERMHSTSAEAAKLAREAGVRRLALTHFSARYRNVRKLLAEARKAMPETIAASDGLRVEVPYASVKRQPVEK